MAKEKEKNEQEGVSEKSKNKLMVIIVIVLVLIILVGAITTIMLIGGDDEKVVRRSTPQIQEKTIVGQKRSSSSANYEDSRSLSEIGVLYPLDTFTVNLKSDAGRRYLKVTMSLELDGEELSLELDNKSPVLRDKIIRILSSKTLEEISSKKGKQKVSNQIMNTLNAMTTDGLIKGIYFTEFVIQ